MDRPTPPAGLSLLVSKTIAARATAKDDHNNNKNKKWKKEVLIATMPPSPIKYYSNPGPQDGRCRQNHGAMEATQKRVSCKFVLSGKK